MPEGAISAFEIAQGVQLPEGYRDFLLRLGNGGAGPYHGLLPLEQWTDAFACSSPDAYGFLAAPSHLVPDTPGAIADVPEDRFHQGTLTIAVDGCGFFTLLVVSGPARGQVVGTDGGYTKQFFYRSTGFLHWYETWLDDDLDREPLPALGSTFGPSVRHVGSNPCPEQAVVARAASFS